MGFSRPQHPDLHILHPNICHVVLIDEDGKLLKDYGVEGNVVMTHLHVWHNPMLAVNLHDRAMYAKTSSGKKALKLLGRDDQIVILNSQKIDMGPVIDELLNKIH